MCQTLSGKISKHKIPLFHGTYMFWGETERDLEDRDNRTHWQTWHEMWRRGIFKIFQKSLVQATGNINCHQLIQGKLWKEQVLVGNSEMTPGFKVEMTIIPSNRVLSRRLDTWVQKFKEKIWTEDEILEPLTYPSGFRAGQKEHSRYWRQKPTDLLEGPKEQNSGSTTVVVFHLNSLHHSCDPEVKKLLPLPPYTPHACETGREKWNAEPASENNHTCQVELPWKNGFSIPAVFYCSYKYLSLVEPKLHPSSNLQEFRKHSFSPLTIWNMEENIKRVLWIPR